MKKEINWTIGSGQQAKVTLELITKEIIDTTDFGVDIEKDTLYIRIEAEVDGKSVGQGHPKKIDHPVAVAAIGKLAMKADVYNQVTSAIEEIESSEEYVSAIEQGKKESATQRAQDENYAAHRRMMNKAMNT